jgi:hypothetical protein
MKWIGIIFSCVSYPADSYCDHGRFFVLLVRNVIQKSYFNLRICLVAWDLIMHGRCSHLMVLCTIFWDITGKILNYVPYFEIFFIKQWMIRGITVSVTIQYVCTTVWVKGYRYSSFIRRNNFWAYSTVLYMIYRTGRGIHLTLRFFTSLFMTIVNFKISSDPT